MFYTLSWFYFADFFISCSELFIQALFRVNEKVVPLSGVLRTLIF